MQQVTARMKAADSLLAPCAVPHEGQLGRSSPEPADDTRSPFQRDRDRIIHTQAFRRLQGKTQVFVAGEESDHVRTRLTHTMEVAQIARDMARTLSLNEDLAECIALAHDLGHPPFGHRGEEALNTWARTNGLTFEHNEQSLRIVTRLEHHSPLSEGLNLNLEVLEGLQKHRRSGSVQSFARGMSLEAQIVDKADEIAYIGHDSDDGLRAGLFSMEDILSTALAREANALATARKTSLRGALIHLLVSDLYRTSEQQLRDAKIHTLADVYAHTEPLMECSGVMKEKIVEMHQFLHSRMYAHPRVVQAGEEGQRIIHLLCAHYSTTPNDKISSLQHAESSTPPRAIMDYVAGMTDAFAKTQASGLQLL